MSIAEIEQLLQSRMGLHSATVGSTTVVRAVEQRMRELALNSLDGYTQLLGQSGDELDALIDTVVIPETWFYRDANPFAAFSDWVRTHWQPRHLPRTLRILSVPCSSGEEPYTLAMCLADCGFAGESAHIDAVDISHSNIERAERAQYGSNSFRGEDLAFRDRHFSRNGERWALNPDIRARVCFEQANILDAGFAARRAPYHVIFCRNLLIYFDRPTQHRAIDCLESLLSPDGILFLGHSETSLLLERDFTPLAYSRCFGFHRTEKRPKRSYDSRNAPVPAPRPRNRQRPRPDPSAPLPFSTSAPAPATQQPPDERQALDAARELANRGRYKEAASHCEALLENPEHQTGAMFLLGVIREAAADHEAAELLFRKVIYLDPDHYEALAHLGALSRQRGDEANAVRYERRAARAQARSATPESTA